MVAQLQKLLEEQPLKWTAVSVQEVINSGYRLEASVYCTEARQIRNALAQCKWDVVNLGDEFIENAFYGGRSKRIYVDKSNKNSVGFLGSSEMLSVQPKPIKFLLKENTTHKFSLKKGQILLSRSGTIGNVGYVSSTLENYFVSEHAIRISCHNYSGYVYTFLKSKEAQLLVKAKTFGAVINQIEPEHLNHIPIPNPPSSIKQKIHDLIETSFKLRDESNELMDSAQALLKDELELPAIDELELIAKGSQFDKTTDVLNYSVPSSEVVDRLDGSYYVPIVKAIEQHIARTSRAVVTVGDISQSVILPGRFKRVYVEEGRGTPFIGGKQIFELDPSNKKYLSLVHHGDRISTILKIKPNSTLITRSGTIGKVAIVPEHWEGWIPNEHIIRVVPASDKIAGYLYTWLASDYAHPLITRHTHGAVVDEVNDVQIASVSVPLLQNESTQRNINDAVLEANHKRTEAYNLEQEALKILDEQVIHAGDCSQER